MTKDEVLKLAKECGLLPDGELPKFPVERFIDYPELQDELISFANAIADLQREKDTKICDDGWAIDGSHTAKQFADAIRVNNKE